MQNTYLRDFRVRTSTQSRRHETRRFCEKCGEELFDSVINFGEKLPKKELDDGFEQSEKADLCLALGSSLRVFPAADMPCETVKDCGKLVIVNLQRTPLDDKALPINVLMDDVMIKLMARLHLENPPSS